MEKNSDFNSFLEEIMSKALEKDYEKIMEEEERHTKELIKIGKKHLDRLGEIEEELTSSIAKNILRNSMNKLAKEIMELEEEEEKIKKESEGNESKI